jgi:hypothetical protein
MASYAFDVASSLANGRATVTTAGTAVQLTATSTDCKWVTVCALTANSRPGQRRRLHRLGSSRDQPRDSVAAGGVRDDPGRQREQAVDRQPGER